MKPTRDDLLRILRNGVAGTSMPAFEAQLTPEELEAVTDYVIALSLRGETERLLVEEASLLEEPAEDSPDAKPEDLVKEGLPDELAAELASGVLQQWQGANEQATLVAPPIPRVEPTPESLARGRDLYLGRTAEKLECAGCHGTKGLGDGSSWIDPRNFNRYVFGTGLEDPVRAQAWTQLVDAWYTNKESRIDSAALDRFFKGSIQSEGERQAMLQVFSDKIQKKWGDDWGNPLRPSNLSRGIYKGGRRPLDLYYRIANGITGTPMPAHASSVKSPEDLWHLVNFVLALPYQPELLEGLSTAAPPPSSVAGRQ
jgi:mono/diheme cytochrome c family protein